MNFIFDFAELGPWTAWSECSVSCNGGKRERSRECGISISNISTNALTLRDYDNPCQEPLSEVSTCNSKKCPEFEDWSEWSSCSDTCGGGFRKKTRRCVEALDNGRRSRSLFDDNPCKGPLEVIEECNQQTCPEWTDWSDWTECSKTCGGGQRRKFR